MSDMPAAAGSGNMSVGGGYVRIGADLGPFHQAMMDANRGLQKGLDTMGSMASKFALDFGRNLAGAFGMGGTAGGMLVAGGVKAVELFANEEQSLKRLALTANRLGMSYGTLQSELTKLQSAFAPIGHMTRAETQDMMKLALEVKHTQMSMEEFFKVSITMAAFGGTSPGEAAASLHGFMKAGGGDLSRFGIFRGAGEDPMQTITKAKQFANEQFGNVESLSGSLPTDQYAEAVSIVKDAGAQMAKGAVVAVGKTIKDARAEKAERASRKVEVDDKPSLGWWVSAIAGDLWDRTPGSMNEAITNIGATSRSIREGVASVWNSPPPALGDFLPERGGDFGNPAIEKMMGSGKGKGGSATLGPLNDKLNELVLSLQRNTDSTNHNTNRM